MDIPNMNDLNHVFFFSRNCLLLEIDKCNKNVDIEYDLNLDKQGLNGKFVILLFYSQKTNKATQSL